MKNKKMWTALYLMALSWCSGAVWAAPGALDMSFGSSGIARSTCSGDPAMGCAYSTASPLWLNSNEIWLGAADGAATHFWFQGGTRSVQSPPNIFPTGADDRYVAYAVQVDGKMVVAIPSAGLFVLARYHPDWTPDLGFGIDGLATTNVGVGRAAMVIQSDGMIVLASNEAAVFGAGQVARFRVDGMPDESFGFGGYVYTPAYALALESSGSILAKNDGQVSRIDTFGNVTPLIDFGIDNPSAYEYVDNALALQPDGMILVAGPVSALEVPPYTGSNPVFAVKRYYADGTPDYAFGPDGSGIAPVNFTKITFPSAIALQSDGKILVAGKQFLGSVATGNNNSTWVLTRFNTSGVLDAGFGSGGQVVASFGSTAKAKEPGILVQPDGNIVLASMEGGGTAGYTFLMARYQGDPVLVDPLSADLALSITENADPLVGGNALVYTLTVTNKGASTAFNSVLSNPLPANVNLVSVTPSQGTCAGGTSVDCQLGDIDSGMSVSVALRLYPTVPGTVYNYAKVSSDTPDANLPDNYGFQSTVVNAGVFDLIPPVLTLPADMTISSTALTTLVNYSATALDALDGPVLANCQPASGSYFGNGVTIVQCNPKDAAGNVASGSFLVNISGTVAPTAASTWAWGRNFESQLNDGSVTQKGSPTSSNLANITAIAAGDYHSIALKSDGTVWSWGWSLSGPLPSISPALAQISGLSGITAIAAGGYHSLAIKPDRTVWAWGGNLSGELGNGTKTSTNTPVKVSTLTNIIAVAAGVTHSLALKSDGTVWSWGDNTHGQLGNGTTVARLTPVQVLGLTGMVAISAGAYHSHALKSDGTVWSWGLNLGNGSALGSLAPVQVSGLTDVIAIASGNSHTLALKADRSVWGWGRNNQGQLGNGATLDQYLPVQAGNLSNIIALSAGADHSLALKADGTVWSFGSDSIGQLANEFNNRLRPAQVNYTANVVAIAAGGQHSLMLTGADSTPPQTLYTATPRRNAADWYNADVALTLKVHEIGSGIQAFYYQVNSDALVTVPGPGATVTSLSQALSVTTEGVTTISYHALDNANNVEATRTLTIRLDKTAPTLSTPAPYKVKTVSKTGVSVNYPMPALSDNLDSSPQLSCLPASGSLFLIGITTVACTATDLAGNTASTSFQVTVENNNVDLTPTAASASSLAGNLVLKDSVKNLGTGSADPFSVGFYLSTDNVYQASDVLICSRSAASLAAGITVAASTTCAIPVGTAPGSYYVIVRDDINDSVAETNESNNNKASSVIKIGADLSFSALTVTSGASLLIKDTVKNAGNLSAAALDVGFYVSTDNVYQAASDIALCGRSVASLAPALSSVNSGVTCSIPALSPGVYYVIAVVDIAGVVVESNETNNIKVSAKIYIGPDLLASSVSVTGTKLSFTIKNTGTVASGDFAVGFYLSSNSTYESTDLPLCSHNVASIAVGAAYAATGITSLTCVVPVEVAIGVYTVMMRVDSGDVLVESNETNNIKAATSKLIVGPDLLPTALSFTRMGSTLTLTHTVKNQGNAAAAFTASFYLSADALYQDTDLLICDKAMPALAAATTGVATSTTCTLPSGAAPGSYRILVREDSGSVVNEANEGNNSKTTTTTVLLP